MTDITSDRIDHRTAVVRPGVEIDLQHAAKLRNALIDLHRDGVVQYVVDMTDVEHVDNTGLSVIYRAWRRAISNGGGLTLAGPSDRIRQVLDSIRFPAMINKDVETALQRTMATV